ncbi:phosphoglucomutase [Schinkia azotoformans]|uniref:phosphoglucomutase n=1 Tax=Schinkia azotoformans TaxID=1454 RepID=UPI002DB76815|nr:phosphoglucomutase [Schinkia azotoformans]MEC1716595.1 phosphoglucomutase [Schinkia azotoformans]MEC1739433.1 phosphoglucomutase [Schinkia azotoformans]MEC1745497.1 phosphoglucomutase [Schinkia azotoformans]MEC1756560.1 phosphoglucomutase [Schinkia azotoformans]MEC1765827.1 phosphoglucomutase [Schinkia azotoformans]
MSYPDEIDRFPIKLNKSDSVYVIEEEVVPVNGVYEGTLNHDNVMPVSVRVYTGSKLTGEKVENFLLSIPSQTPWKKSIKIFSDKPKLYITYETSGDQVEADDINSLQDAIVNTQTELERYKADGLIDGGTFERG